jgi:hypothetical protein
MSRIPSAGPARARRVAEVATTRAMKARLLDDAGQYDELVARPIARGRSTDAVISRRGTHSLVSSKALKRTRSSRSAAELWLFDRRGDLDFVRFSWPITRARFAVDGIKKQF